MRFGWIVRSVAVGAAGILLAPGIRITSGLPQ